MRMLIRLLGSAVLTIILSACGTFSTVESKNKIASVFRDPEGGMKHVERADLISVERIEHGDGAFIGVSISGGGSRAATFGGAVLVELERYGLLNDLDAIVGISGGSLAASYYALHRNGPEWNEDIFLDKMSTDYLTPFIGKYLSPQTLAKISFSDYSRSDVMAEIFEGLFDNATFQALNANRGPQLLISATNVTRGGKPFLFTNSQFEAIYSEINDVHIATATMASGAFPGVFDDVTLVNYSIPGKEITEHGDEFWHKSEANRNDVLLKNLRYEHLIDGGPSDNLGIRTLMESAKDFAISRTYHKRPVTGCTLYVIDAANSADRVGLRQVKNPKSWYDYLLNTNVVDATDALLNGQRQSALREFKVDEIGSHSSEIEIKWGGPFGLDKSEDEHSMKCVVWHISFEAMNTRQNLVDSPESASEKTVRRAIRRITAQTKTSYKLSGPKGCDGNQLREALEKAAHWIVTQDDGGSALMSACIQTNLMERGNSKACQQVFEDKHVEVKPLSFDLLQSEKDETMAPDEQADWVADSVECR